MGEEWLKKYRELADEEEAPPSLTGTVYSTSNFQINDKIVYLELAIDNAELRQYRNRENFVDNRSPEMIIPLPEI
jgi:hypothetical protein